MAFPYLNEDDDPLLPDGTPKSLAPKPLDPMLVDYLSQKKAEQDALVNTTNEVNPQKFEREALVNATNEVNPLALAFSGLSGLGAALQGRDVSGAMTNTMNLAKSGAVNRLKQFDEKTRLEQAGKDRATKDKFDQANLARIEDEKALRARENDPNSPESRQMAEAAVARGYKGDPSKLTVAQVRQLSPSLDKIYQAEQDRIQQARQARLDIENAAYRREDLADRREARALSREDRALRREEVDLLRQQKEAEKNQKLVTPFGDANTPKDADDIKNSTVALETLRGSIGRIKELRESEGGETFNTDARVEAKALASAARGQLKEMLKLGVLSATDYSILDSQIPADPLANEYTSPFSSPTKTTLDTTLKNTEAAFRAGLKTRLAKPNDAGRQIIETGAPDATGGAQLMVFPDGQRKMIPADKVDAMIKAGGKVA